MRTIPRRTKDANGTFEEHKAFLKMSSVWPSELADNESARIGIGSELTLPSCTDAIGRGFIHDSDSMIVVGGSTGKVCLAALTLKQVTPPSLPRWFRAFAYAGHDLK